MKNYKSIKHFTEEMQHPKEARSEQKPGNHQPGNKEKEPEISLKKVFQFFKNIKP